jgi:hypothetical protein
MRSVNAISGPGIRLMCNHSQWQCMHFLQYFKGRLSISVPVYANPSCSGIFQSQLISLSTASMLLLLPATSAAYAAAMQERFSRDTAAGPTANTRQFEQAQD